MLADSPAPELEARTQLLSYLLSLSGRGGAASQPLPGPAPRPIQSSPQSPLTPAQRSPRKWKKPAVSTWPGKAQAQGCFSPQGGFSRQTHHSDRTERVSSVVMLPGGPALGQLAPLNFPATFQWCSHHPHFMDAALRSEMICLRSHMLVYTCLLELFYSLWKSRPCTPPQTQTLAAPTCPPHRVQGPGSPSGGLVSPTLLGCSVVSWFGGRCGGERVCEDVGGFVCARGGGRGVCGLA